jgi:hypothetical protein
MILVNTNHPCLRVGHHVNVSNIIRLSRGYVNHPCLRVGRHINISNITRFNRGYVLGR